METSEVLTKTGLSDKEAQVYLGLLELGTASVDSIAKKAGTKRPTTYLILDSLQARGLVSVVPRAKKSLYQAESPQTIISDLNRKEELVKRFLPDMLAVYNAKKEKPQMQLFEGREGVKEVYDKIFATKEVWFFATIRDFIKFYPEFADEIKRKSEAGLMKVREILSRSKADLEFAETVKHSEYYEHRIAPEGLEFQTDNAIYDNTTVFFSYSPHVFAVVITSQVVTRSMRTLFELAWRASETYEKVTKN